VTGTNIVVQYARYTKIGRQVTVSGTVSHTGAITSYSTITLPIAPEMPTTESRYSGGIQFFELGTGTTALNLRLLTQQNLGSGAYFWGQDGGEQWTYSMAYDGTNGIVQYTFTLTYTTAT
jgi:hypothetical protein